MMAICTHPYLSSSSPLSDFFSELLEVMLTPGILPQDALECFLKLVHVSKARLGVQRFQTLRKPLLSFVFERCCVSDEQHPQYPALFMCI